MNQGKLQQFDTPLDIYNRPANRFVAEFVGSPSMNFFDGRFDATTGMFAGDGLTLNLQHEVPAITSERVTLGIRPEHIQVSATEQVDWPAAAVYVTEQMGSETLVFLQIKDRKVIARASGDFRAEPESKVWIQFDTAKAHFFDPSTGLRV